MLYPCIHKSPTLCFREQGSTKGHEQLKKPDLRRDVGKRKALTSWPKLQHVPACSHVVITGGAVFGFVGRQTLLRAESQPEHVVIVVT